MPYHEDSLPDLRNPEISSVQGSDRHGVARATPRIDLSNLLLNELESVALPGKSESRDILKEKGLREGLLENS
jgi:hypothetical protein